MVQIEEIIEIGDKKEVEIINLLKEEVVVLLKAGEEILIIEEKIFLDLSRRKEN